MSFAILVAALIQARARLLAWRLLHLDRAQHVRKPVCLAPLLCRLPVSDLFWALVLDSAGAQARR